MCVSVLIVIYCVLLHGLLLCGYGCDCGFSVHVLVRFVCFCVLLYGSRLPRVLLWLYVFFFVYYVCVSFVVYCETLYVLFVCAFRDCGLFSVFVCNLCDLLCDVVWCVCLCVPLCEYVCLEFNVFVCFVCGLSGDVVCCVGAYVCVCVCCLKMCLLYVCFVL